MEEKTQGTWDLPLPNLQGRRRKRGHICWPGPRGITRLGGNGRKIDFWLREKLSLKRSKRGWTRVCHSKDSISDKTLRLFLELRNQD